MSRGRSGFTPKDPRGIFSRSVLDFSGDVEDLDVVTERIQTQYWDNPRRVK